jgi:hypothetical protein
VRVTSEDAAVSNDCLHLSGAATSQRKHAAARNYSKAGSISLAGHNRLQQKHHEEELFQQLRSAASSDGGLRGGS